MPSRHIANKMPASFRAKATAAMRLPRRSVIRLAHPSAPLRLLSAFGLCGASGHDVVLASRFVSSVRDPRAVAPAGTHCYEVPDWRLGAMAKIDRGLRYTSLGIAAWWDRRMCGG